MSLPSLLYELDRARASLAQSAGGCVVSIDAGRQPFAGIGWRESLIVAPAERLTRSREVRVVGPLGEATGEVVALDLATDVGIVRSTRLWDRGVPPSTTKVAVGESVALVGREGLDVVADWRPIRKVGQAWRSRRGARIGDRIEVDAGPASIVEGSAVFASDGGCIGMAVYGPQRRLIVIPAATVEPIVGDFEAHGRLRRGYLGVSLLPLPLSAEAAARWQVAAGTAFVVADVSAGSPAEAAGLQVGDCLTSADGAGLHGVRTLAGLIRDRGPGAVLRLSRRRGGTTEELAVTLGEHTGG